jgi:hypothetical protein
MNQKAILLIKSQKGWVVFNNLREGDEELAVRVNVTQSPVSRSHNKRD